MEKDGTEKEKKEYNAYGFLIFKGSYLNGEKNGRVEEYYLDNGKIKFIGEYKNGKKWKRKRNRKWWLYRVWGRIFHGERWNGKESYYTGEGVISLEYSNGKKIEEK